MRDRFQCLHSGNCCEKPYTQISLSVGDILRLSRELDLSVELLFREGIVGIAPFFETDFVFECGLGLKIPCRLRKDERCIAYKARPLNCRLFPFWLLAEMPEDKIRLYVDESYECVHSVRLDSRKKGKYSIYTRKIGEIIGREAELTEKIIGRLLRKEELLERIDISKQEGFRKVCPKLSSKIKLDKDPAAMQLKEAENLRVGFAEEIINRYNYSRISAALIEEISRLGLSMDFCSAEQLELFEKERES